MLRVNISAICDANPITRGDGARVRKAIEDAWRAGDTIELDFANIRIASVSFFDEAIGLLARDRPVEVLRKSIRVDNIDPADRRLLNRIVMSRAKERSTNKRESSVPAR